MDRITQHQLRIIKVAIIAFAAVAVVGYSYEIGRDLVAIREPGPPSPPGPTPKPS